jgi:hypothetical protein
MSNFVHLHLCLAAGSIGAFLMSGSPCVSQDTPLPPNTLPCDAFAKRAEGIWVAKKPVTFVVGNAKNLTLDAGEITPKSQNLGGIDLYVLLEAKCGKTPA